MIRTDLFECGFDLPSDQRRRRIVYVFGELKRHWPFSLSRENLAVGIAN